MPDIFGIMQQEQFFQSLNAVIQSPKRITVLSHVNPDGDAIGSSLAFSQFLRKMGHEVEVMVPNDFPEFLAWMPGASSILIFDKNTDLAKRILKDSEVIMVLDFNHFSRSGLIIDTLKELDTKKILVDHHRDTDFGLFYCAWSETNVSSTSELVAEIVFHYGESYLDESMATNLLVGIITDTGSFAHSIYHSRTLELCAKLTEKSMPYTMIHQLVYDTFTENRLRLLGYAISNKMEVLDAYATAIISLDKTELERFDYQVGDTEGVVNFPLSMKKIRMAVLVTERQDVVRFSFRSKGDFSVHELAHKHFNGGGHTNAAGGTLSCPMEEALEKLHQVLPEYQELLNKKD